MRNISFIKSVFARAGRRNGKGYLMAETAASCVFMLPIIFIILFAVVQLVQAYLISTVLTQAATKAARQLAVLYPENNLQILTRGFQDSAVFGNINYSGIIANVAQFDNAVFNTTVDPPTVTVTVHYLGGQYGLTPFPSCDPLGLGANFQLSGSSVYKLESF